MQFSCNPFDKIKEPECLQKWQLLKLDEMIAQYRMQVGYYRKFAPMQEKMMKYIEREIDEATESDKWKYNADEPDDDEPREDDYR
jgi:hypothetical protein